MREVEEELMEYLVSSFRLFPFLSQVMVTSGVPRASQLRTHLGTSTFSLSQGTLVAPVLKIGLCLTRTKVPSLTVLGLALGTLLLATQL